jgi:hypothetical protein
LNVIPALPLAVVTVSLISMPDDTVLGTVLLLLFISVGPVCSVTLPTSPLLVVGLNSKRIARTSDGRNHFTVN